MMRKAIRTTVLFLTIITAAVMGYVSYLDASLPEDLYRRQNAPVLWSGCPSVSVVFEEEISEAGAGFDDSRPAEFSLLGLIPIKEVSVTAREERYLIPCGTPFGLKMLTDGVIAVGFSPVETLSGTVCPVREAGLLEGDIIKTVNGEEVNSYRKLKKLVAASGGEALTVTAERDGKTMTFSVDPVLNLSGEYQCGIWVRDSSAGIGTMTFYDPSTGVFGGLGHGVTDADTGELMPFLSGEAVPVSILNVVKGNAGSPGELQGSFTSTLPCGKLTGNTEAGVFGVSEAAFSHREALPAALGGEVHEGEATILATLSGNEPREYTICIEKLDQTHNTRNMVICVTDKELLEASGGIVQGMSGSPILQDGKLIGAVTHVFVNEPCCGYGIFIENMLDAAG